MPSSPKNEDISSEPPTSIDPYAVLGLERAASAQDVKAAYRKLALLRHPDKVSDSSLKSAAHTAFQELAFAYAVLADEKRRRRYDSTGNTAETLSIEDDDFDWVEFFRNQFKESFTEEKVARFAEEYKESEEEKNDILLAYEKGKGNMDFVFENVMLSNPLEDENRFRKIIDNALKEEKIKTYDAYVKESAAKKKKRMDKAKKEAKAAEKETAKKGKKPGTAPLDDLAALIRDRNRGKSSIDALIENISKKYVPEGKGTKRKANDEPPEEAFEANRKQTAKESESDEEEEELPPAKKAKPRRGLKKAAVEKPVKAAPKGTRRSGRASQAVKYTAPDDEDDEDNDGDGVYSEGADSDDDERPKKRRSVNRRRAKA